MLLDRDPEALPLGIGLVLFLTVTLGGGGLTVYQGLQALSKRPSRPLRLPPLWAVGGGFALALAIGLGLQQVEICAPLLFPLCLMAAALAPPLAAVGWMLDQQAGTLTWRRAGVAFVGGATVSVMLAIILEVLLPGVVLLLVLDLAEPVLDGLEGLFDALAGREVAKVLTSPGFLFALVELAVVAPLVEETVKPLVTLPLLRHIERPRDALLLGAAAGAGFAVLENVLSDRATRCCWAQQPAPGSLSWRTSSMLQWGCASGRGYWPCGLWGRRCILWALVWWLLVGTACCGAAPTAAVAGWADMAWPSGYTLYGMAE
jgi:hypothetical protein